MPGTKDFQGKLLISQVDGSNLGEVKDLCLNADATAIAGIHIGKEGLINRKSLTLPLSHVKLFGKDAWLVDCTEDAIERDDSSSLVLASSFKGREIQTVGGTRIGIIQDVVVNDCHTVLGFSLSKVLAQGPLSDSKLVPRNSVTNLGAGDEPVIANLEEVEKSSAS